MWNDKKIFICIPTYNEAENIENLIKEIFGLGIENLKVIVIDDNSPDKTGEIADKLAENYSIKVIHRKGKLGLGSAYIAGFKYALKNQADLIFEMDADFSHNPKDIPRFLEEIKNGNEVVLGSRKIEQGEIKDWNLWRHFCSNGAMLFSRILLRLKTKDVTTGFRCYKREALESLNLDNIKSNGYAFQEEMIYLCEKKDFKIKEIPITFIDRKYGKSKLAFKDIIEFFIKIVRLKISR
ncbi:polyprenol monophosphomannose synthase [Candidatus Falkowbacteria bacterium]|jgi:dolichol-phosphate mannosyltransferase|nr:polyprenol monophosphomannose synthase [Candidatus Falkowbacteria bacterium]MBT4433367.1 polyprenol monophosphomannose synthase [Candidatus Falkowbacteria bacterium]